MNLLKNQQAAETVDGIYLALEEQIMQNIARHLRGWKKPIDSDRWLLQKLAELGALNQENIQIIARMSGISLMAAERMLNEAAEEAVQTIDAGFQTAVHRGLAGEAVEADKSKNVKQVMKNMRKQAKDALNLTNTTMLYKAQEAYRSLLQETAKKAKEILNNNAAAVVTGAESRQRALKTTIRKFNEQGITGFVDKRGRNWTPEAYVNMCMRNTAKNVAEEVQTARCRDHGVTLIQISSHAGARPKCAKDQGKVYDLNNKSGTTTDANGREIRYYPWNSSSYGEPDGILGINCRHHKFPFRPGISLQSYFPTEDMDANDKLYKQTQVQRALERDVRKQKRECMLYDTIGDKDAFEEASVRLKAKEAKLKNYVDTHKDLHRRKDREQVVGFDKGVSAGVVAANKRTQKLARMGKEKESIDWSNTRPTVVSKEDKREIISYARDKNINIVDLSKFDGDKMLLKQEIDTLSDMIKEYPEVSTRRITLTVGNLPDDEFASTRNRTITLNSNALRNKRITEENIKKSGIFASPKVAHISIHEFGHIISGVKGNKGIEIAKKAYYNIFNKDITDLQIILYLKNNISQYAVKYNGDYEYDLRNGKVRAAKFIEITSEVLAKEQYRSDAFTREYLRLLKEK